MGNLLEEEFWMIWLLFILLAHLQQSNISIIIVLMMIKFLGMVGKNQDIQAYADWED